MIRLIQICAIGIICWFLCLLINLLNSSIFIESSIIAFHPFQPRLWSYRNVRNWHLIDPNFSICKHGRNQSPIDIQTELDSRPFIGHEPTDHSKSAELVLTLEDINSRTFDSFRAQRVEHLSSSDLSYEHFHSSNTAQIVYNTVTHLKLPHDGRKYKLLQSHYHAPSDHSFDGHLADAELHLVHQAENGQLAVIGVLLNGQPDAEVDLDPKISIHDFILQRAYTQKDEYFIYKGSLTTPPCTENVTFLLSAKILNVPQSWLNKFIKTTNEQEQLATHRPIQERNGRIVSVVNSRVVDKTTQQVVSNIAFNSTLREFVQVQQSSKLSGFAESVRNNITALIVLAGSFAVLIYWRQTLKKVTSKGKMD